MPRSEISVGTKQFRRAVAKPAPHRPAPTLSQRENQSRGAAVVRRGTFQPQNPRQQARLHADVLAEADRLEQIHRQRVAHAKAKKLYAQGKRKEALAVQERAGLGRPHLDIFERTGKDFATLAIHSPAGLYEAGKAVGLDVKDVLPPEAGGAPRGAPIFPRTRRVAAATGRGFAEDVQHPLRHPGFTLLDLFGAASLGTGTAARGVGAASRLGIGGERAAGLARALDPAHPRTIRVGDLEAHPPTSRNRAFLAAQRLHDRALSGEPKGPRSVRALAQEHYLPRRMGFELEQSRKINEAVQRAPAGGLIAAGKKLSTPQQIALRSVAEETPIPTQIEFHRNRIKSLRGTAPKVALERKRHQRQIVLLRRAEQYVSEQDGKLALAHPHLQDVYEKTAQVAKNREEMLTAIGRLTPDAARGRVSGPGKIYRGESLASSKPLAIDLGPDAPGTIYHGSPEGYISEIDPLRHTNAWREGIGFYLTENLQKAEGYARGRTAKGERRLAASASGKVSAFRLKKGTKVLDMDKPADLPFWRSVAKDKGLSESEFDYYIARQAGRNPTNNRIREELLHQLHDELGSDAPYAVEEALTERGFQATTHIEGGHRVWVVKDKDAVERVQSQSERVAQAMASQPPSFEGGQFRVPHQEKRGLRSLSRHGQMGSAGSVGIPRAPGSVTHEFQGVLQRQARMRQDTTRLIGESNLEAQRYGALLRARDQFKAAAHDTPESEHDIPIRMDALKQHPLPKEAKQYLERLQRKAEEGVKLTGQEKAQLSHAYDHVHRELFPGDPASLSADEQARFAELAQQGKIKWVDSRLLRGLDKPRPLATLGTHQALRVAASIPRAINQASKAAILYLKPAYAIPNMMGNAALVIAQQGFGAPRNIAQSVRWWHALDHEGRSAVMSSVGEGIAQSLAGSGSGRAISFAANQWSRAVDAPFRFNAFVYEARRAGIGGPAELRSLVDKIQNGTATKAERLKFETAARKANAAMIDYGRLGPVERDIIRNVVFFYPWVKGSTLYAGHFLREHPAQAAFLGQMGKQGQAQSQRDLGNLPSYAEGIFKVGGSKDLPTVVNPASTSILQTPAQVEQAIEAFATGHVRKADNPLTFLTPALAAGEAALTRRDPLTGRELKGSGLGIIARELTGGLPQVSLAKRLGAFGGSKSKLYPMSGRQAIGQFLLGGISPRTLDRKEANALAKSERDAMLSTPERFATNYKDARKTILSAARKQDPEAVSTLDHELKLYAARYGAYKKAGARDQLERYTVDVKLLRQMGKVTPAEAKAGIAWAEKAKPDQIEKQRRLIGSTVFATSNLNYAAKKLGVSLPR